MIFLASCTGRTDQNGAYRSLSSFPGELFSDDEVPSRSPADNEDEDDGDDEDDEGDEDDGDDGYPGFNTSTVESAASAEDIELTDHAFADPDLEIDFVSQESEPEDTLEEIGRVLKAMDEALTDTSSFGDGVRRIEIDFANEDGSDDRVAIVNPDWTVAYHDGDLSFDQYLDKVRGAIQ